MTPPAQVTEAHLELAKTVIFSRDSAGRLLTAPMGAQLIADSEAKAVEAERARLYGIGRKKGEQPVSSDMDIGHRCLSGDKWPQPVDPIAECARLGRELADSIAERDQLRAERNNLRADLDAIKAIRDEETARAERAESQLHALRLVCGTTDADKFSTWVDRANTRAEKAEADLATAKAIIASIEEDGTEEHNAAVRLRQELAAERARLDWLELRGPWDSWNGFGETGITLRENIRAAIDAAMKEGA